jgi:DNA-binding transcriptional LysR family regulator
VSSHDAYRRAGFDPDTLEVSMVVGSAGAVVDSVRAGLGIGVVSESEVPRHASDIVGVRLTDAVTRSLWLVLSDRPPPPSSTGGVRRARDGSSCQHVALDASGPVTLLLRTDTG